MQIWKNMKVSRFCQINNLALYGYICSFTQSPVHCSLCDLRKPEAFLSFYPDSLCDHSPIFLPPTCKWLSFLAAFIGINTKCFSPLTLHCLWGACPDNPNELHKRLVNGRSVEWAWRKSAYDARSFLVYMGYNFTTLPHIWELEFHCCYASKNSEA